MLGADRYYKSLADGGEETITGEHFSFMINYDTPEEVK